MNRYFLSAIIMEVTTMIMHDENYYSNKVLAIDDARRNIYEDSLKFDISQLWNRWRIGGLSRRVMMELGLVESSSDSRWNFMLDDSIMAVYQDELGRIWVVEDNYGKASMRLSASDSGSFEKNISKRYLALRAA
jgi:hypothetical protein